MNSDLDGEQTKQTEGAAEGETEGAAEGQLEGAKRTEETTATRAWAPSLGAARRTPRPEESRLGRPGRVPPTGGEEPP